MERESFMAKKVYFLYSHYVVRQTLVQELVNEEYAVYLVSGYKKLLL
ncbi:MAG: hypothetical protein PQJ46_02430 [Spirochaetales bacterium]|nr:hypothetical protein [Spirochaetales bacterium]